MPYQGMDAAHQVPPAGMPIRLCPVCQKGLFGRVWAKSEPGSQAATHQRDAAPGDVVYRKGALGRTVFSICKGAVKLELSAPDGQPRVVRVLQAGAVFGLEILSDSRYHHTATCLGRVQLCEIPAEAINATALHDADLHASLMALWQAQADEADAVIAELCTGAARERLARLLLHMVRGRVTHTCQSMSREDMASLLDLTPETVSRTMAAFKRSGLVAEQGGVLACELAGLERISQGMD